MRTIPSPYSIATTHTVEEMKQQEGKWFMNNLRAMIQDELKQALAGLIPLPAVETTLVTDIVQPAPTILPALTAHVPAVVPPAVVNPLVMDAPPASNNNAGGQPLNAARNAPIVEMKFENIENYMVEKSQERVT